MSSRKRPASQLASSPETNQQQRRQYPRIVEPSLRRRVLARAFIAGASKANAFLGEDEAVAVATFILRQPYEWLQLVSRRKPPTDSKDDSSSSSAAASSSSSSLLAKEPPIEKDRSGVEMAIEWLYRQQEWEAPAIADWLRMAIHDSVDAAAVITPSLQDIRVFLKDELEWSKYQRAEIEFMLAIECMEEDPYEIGFESMAMLLLKGNLRMGEPEWEAIELCDFLAQSPTCPFTGRAMWGGCTADLPPFLHHATGDEELVKRWAMRWDVDWPPPHEDGELGEEEGEEESRSYYTSEEGEEEEEEEEEEGTGETEGSSDGEQAGGGRVETGGRNVGFGPVRPMGPQRRGSRS